MQLDSGTSSSKDLGNYPSGTREPVKELQSQLVVLPRTHHPVNAKFPIALNLDRDGLRLLLLDNAYRAFSEGILADTKGRSRKQVDAIQVNQRQGAFTIIDDEKIKITPAHYRPLRVTPNQLDEYIYRQQFETQEWSAKHLGRRFYSKFIEPYCSTPALGTPVEWAAERTAILAGFLFYINSGDLPFAAARYGYEMAANVVCNLTPPELKKDRQYRLNEIRTPLMEAARRRFGSSLSGEDLILVFDLAGRIESATISSGSFDKLHALLPQALKNGLIIDRLTELVEDFVASGVPIDRSLDSAAQMVSAIYCGDDRPWWFKENFDLRPSKFSSAIAPDIAIQLAELAGPAYAYAAELYCERRTAIASGTGLALTQQLQVIVEVATNYGIGNLPRACNVLDFLIEALRESNDPREQQDIYEHARSGINRHRPESVLNGVLEGGDVNFDKPGLAACIIAFFGKEQVGPNKIDDLTSKAADLRNLYAVLSTSVTERAATRPVLAGDVDFPPLLTTQLTSATPKALPLVQGMELRTRTVGSPLLNWLRFDDQLNRECSKDRADNIASIYFSTIAARMPEPFSPPPGFLTSLQRVLDTTDPNYRFPYLEEPDLRSQVRQINRQSEVARTHAIGFLIEGWSHQLLSWVQVQEVITWILDGPRVDQHNLLSTSDEDGTAVNVMIDRRRTGGERLKSLVDSIRLFQARIEILDSYGQVDPIEGRGLIPFLAGVRSGPVFVKEDGSGYAIGVGQDLSMDLERLVGLGIVDRAALTGRLLNVSNGSDWKELLGDVLPLVRAYVATTELGERLNWQVECVPSWERTDDRNCVLVDEFNSAIDALWENIPHGLVKDEQAISRFIDNQVWVDRYELAHSILNHPQKRLDSCQTQFAPTSVEASAVQSSNRYLAVCVALEGTTAISRAERRPQVTSSLESTAALIVKRGNEMSAAVSQWRRQSFGLLPIGGKIHMLHEVSPKRLEFLKARFGFTDTSFRLQHANRSLILPPMPSSGELAYLIQVLCNEELIDTYYPEIQVTASGALNPQDCAYLGAAILLLTEQGVEYNAESFGTTHDSDTNFRIMAYDKGGPRLKLPFVSRQSGRTDMLGRRDLLDIPRYQIIKSVLDHAQQDPHGQFGVLARPFKEMMIKVLGQYGLDKVLSASWIKSSHGEYRSGEEHFREAIKPCTDAWFECQRAAVRDGRRSGVVADLKILFDWLVSEVRIIQEQMLVDRKFANERVLLGIE